jgi:hypothetical protein
VTSLIFKLTELTAGLPSLTGVARARQLLARLIARTADQQPKGILFLDFDGVGDASASFLRESILAFRDWARAYEPELYPVLANISEGVREEFVTLLRDRREAMPGCRLGPDGALIEAEVLGVLEPGLSETLSHIRERGPVTLQDLWRTGDTKPTAVSNRVASLIRQGFVVTTPEPKRRAYSFVLANAGGS